MKVYGLPRSYLRRQFLRQSVLELRRAKTIFESGELGSPRLFGFEEITLLRTSFSIADTCVQVSLRRLLGDIVLMAHAIGSTS